MLPDGTINVEKSTSVKFYKESARRQMTSEEWNYPQMIVFELTGTEQHPVYKTL